MVYNNYFCFSREYNGRNDFYFISFDDLESIKHKENISSIINDESVISLAVSHDKIECYHSNDEIKNYISKVKIFIQGNK